MLLLILSIWSHDLHESASFSTIPIDPTSISSDLLDASYIVQIHTSAATLDASVTTQTPIQMTAQNGRKFTCFVPREGKSDTPEPISEMTLERALASRREASAKLKRAHPACFVTQDDGGWEISICHERLMRKVKGNEILDLGDYTGDKMIPLLPELVAFRNPDDPAALVYTQQYGRTIQVQYGCGPELAKLETFGSRTDLSTHAYYFITSSEFCLTSPGATGETSQEIMTRLLRPLERSCIQKNEGWWTYEFCFGQSVRQYHRDEKSGRMVAEYLMGTYVVPTTTTHVFTTELYLDDGETPRVALVQEFTHGTACKEDNVRRSTRVILYCQAQSLAQSILSVKEVQTCQYDVSIATPAICAHPKFEQELAAAKDTTHTVHCIPDLTTT